MRCSCDIVDGTGRIQINHKGKKWLQIHLLILLAMATTPGNWCTRATTLIDTNLVNVDRDSWTQLTWPVFPFHSIVEKIGMLSATQNASHSGTRLRHMKLQWFNNHRRFLGGPLVQLQKVMKPSTISLKAIHDFYLFKSHQLKRLRRFHHHF